MDNNVGHLIREAIDRLTAAVERQTEVLREPTLEIEAEQPEDDPEKGRASDTQ